MRFSAPTGKDRATPAMSQATAMGVDHAMRALQDVRLVRGLLDQAEINAVRAALAGGRRLSEVAAILGITREQAVGRWSDLVEPSDLGHRH
jgi:hypothetical protein